MKKLVCLLMAMACIAFLIFAPEYISSGLGKSIYEIKEERKETRYEGHIELWHVVSFKTPSSSGYSFLMNRMRALQKQLPYVYINVNGMTVEEAQERMASGERPDVISYPQGFIEEEKLLKLELKSFADAFQPKTMYAYPYMADSYVLVVNSDKLFEEGISCTIGDVMEEDIFLYTCENIENALTFSDIYGLDSEYILSGIELQEGGMSFDVQPSIELSDICITEGGMDAFKAGDSAMIICPYAEYVKMTEGKDAPNFAMQYYDISRKTDLIQNISAFDSGDAEKNAVLLKVCNCLVGTTSQKKILDLAMFPIIDLNIEDISRMNSYELLFKEG